MAVPPFVHQFISCWTFCLLPLFEYYEQHCSALLCTSFSVDVFLTLLGVYLEVELLGHMVTICLTF